MSQVFSLSAEFLSLRDSLLLYAELILRDKPKVTAEDVLQDLWVKLSAHPDQRTFESQGHIRGWFRRCVQHLAIDKLRKADRDILINGGDGHATGPLNSDGQSLLDLLSGSFTTPSGAAVRTEECDRVARAMRQLDPQHRKVLVALYISKESRAAVAASFGITTSQIDTLAAKARARLESLLSVASSLNRPMETPLQSSITYG